MTATPPEDVIDRVLGLDESSDLLKLRERRSKLKHLTQTSYLAALRPAEPRNFSYALRAALAARMSALWKAKELHAHYIERLAEEEEAPTTHQSLIRHRSFSTRIPACKPS